MKGRRRKVAGKRRGGYVRKRDAYLVRDRDRRQAAERLLRRGADGSESGTDSNDAENGANLSDQRMPPPPGFEDHPAFDVRFERKQEKEKEKEKDGVQKRRGGPGQLSDRLKAKFLRRAEKAQEEEDLQLSFYFAFKGGHLRVARRLIETGKVDVNVEDTKTGRTPLHDAVLEGDLEKAEFLCRFGGDLFALDPRFRNPLQRAVEAGNLEMVKLLQQWGGVAAPDQRPHKSRR